MPPEALYTIDLQPVGKRIEVPAGTTILSAARQAGVDLMTVCGGEGICASCAVRIHRGEVSPQTIDETILIEGGDLERGHRLACRTRVVGDVRVEIPPATLPVSQRLQLEGTASEVIPLPPPRLADAIARATRPVGLAVDLGTTKIAGYLVDLETGAILAKEGLVNPQVAFGEDVVSRIAYANRSDEHRMELGELLSGAVNELSEALCRKTGSHPSEILEVVVAGNTAMHHLFTRLPVRSLGEAPYLPSRTEAMDLEAATLEIRSAPQAGLFVPPNIASYVGADHVAMLLATGIGERRDTVLALDIGTNTEITLAHEGRLLSCSCASGPAFEGAHIHDGCRAIPGAIDRVRLIDEAYLVHTIDRARPVGICGSGILDAVAAMREGHVINASGRLMETSELVRRTDGRLEFVLSPAEYNGHGRDVVVTREDVHQIQLAKAAIRTGIDALMKEAGVSPKNLKTVILAGAFGTYLDVSSAIRIGMLPPVDPARVQQVGNAAGMGAVRMLLSMREREAAIALTQRIEYVELTTWPGFQDHFIEALYLH